MLIDDFIKELQKLPKGSTTGTLNIDDLRIVPTVSIKTNKDTVVDSV